MSEKLKKEVLIRRNLHHNFSLKEKLFWAFFGSFDEKGNTEAYCDSFWGHDFTPETIKRAQNLLSDTIIHKIVWREYNKNIVNPKHKSFYYYNSKNNKKPPLIRGKDNNADIQEALSSGSIWMSASAWNHINITPKTPEGVDKTRLVHSFTLKRNQEKGCEALILTSPKTPKEDGLDPNTFWEIRNISLLGDFSAFNTLTKRKFHARVFPSEYDKAIALPSLRRILKLKKTIPGALWKQAYNILKKQKKEVCNTLKKQFTPFIRLKNGVELRSNKFYIKENYNFDFTLNLLAITLHYVPFYNNKKLNLRYSSNDFTFSSFPSESIEVFKKRCEYNTRFIDDKFSTSFIINDRKCDVKMINIECHTPTFKIKVENMNNRISIEALTFRSMKRELKKTYSPLFGIKEISKDELINRYFYEINDCINSLDVKNQELAERITCEFSEFIKSLPETSTFYITCGENFHYDFHFILNEAKGYLKAIWYEDYDYWNIDIDFRFLQTKIKLDLQYQ